MRRPLLVVICLIVPLLPVSSHVSAFAGPRIVTSAEIDLNGDGKAEKIAIRIDDKTGSYVLNVTTTVLKGELECVDGFAVVDIDQADKYKEIAIHTPGPSDDDLYLVYWFDGKGLRKMGELSRWPSFVGNGIVYVDDWMGFWSLREKYVLEIGTRTLRKVPQEFYRVGQEAKVAKGFPIYRTRDDRSEIVANLRSGSKIMILVCDVTPKAYGDDWYLIQSETNLIGWARERVFPDCLQDLPWAD